MTTPTDIRQKAIELIEKLPQDKLNEAFIFLESLSKTETKASSILEEKALIEIIQRRLSPEEQQQLDDLRDRNEWGHLTEAEHRELLTYEDVLEHQNVERINALIKLAKLRNADLATLNRQFRSDSQKTHAF